MLPLGFGRFMHLVVLYGYQGADHDPEQLALTEQLFDAALSELSVVARGQPCLIVGDSDVEPTRIPCLAKGISAGLGLMLRKLGLWLLVCNQHLLVNGTGILLVVIVGILWLVALLRLLLFFPAWFSLIGRLLSILRFGLFLTTAGGIVGLRS